MLKYQKNRKKFHNILTDWLVYEFQRSGFRFDRSAARYRDNKTGRFVAESQVLRTVEGYAGFAQDNMSNITQRYIDGKINIRDWQKGMRQEIKDSHIVSHCIGYSRARWT
jgi:hypothetical protein